ncbi:putative RNA-binding Zn-ribbon protein involved in translation (DUF1610 family) [Rhizobium sp. BK512]|uniref:DUF4145 domain-containing protein n=1 Tax=Rhizobium sp. BK512 TaxID=2587010 RepID=UPI00179AD7D2|nr:DUF4145 domain-containing protein [Rhizobium sp. BK512]MBB3562366.1 putative RNA-binding Zn-ribbon protein involved in translation (DUF1610 family) [Rhizobium sp. BK512]
MKTVAPSITQTAFNCPHCGVLAHQHWFSVYAEGLTNGKLPALPDPDELERARNIGDSREREKVTRLLTRLLTHHPVIVSRGYHADFAVENVWLTKCFNCQEVAIWRADTMAYPEPTLLAAANSDTPPEIVADYDEARAIFDKSPRGAAALLRLSIQKLCQHLGEPGKNINNDIASLVAKGLDVRIQRALDVLRVVGNEAVHPGTIDLNDDRSTAESLFKLFNLIVEKMISEPKLVDEVYASLPGDKLRAIETRDKEKTGKAK